MSTAVEALFGPAFGQLHPLLQALHRSGGTLRGRVDVRFGRGLAGVVGRRLARRLGLPPCDGPVPLIVDIHGTGTALHWDRRFGQASTFFSTFTPVGHHPTGRWVESLGLLRLDLGVSIVDGGWVWQPRGGGRLGGMPLPAWLLPRAVHLTAGADRLACMSMSDKGLLRWYADCCRTPFGNTPRDPRISYVGRVSSCLGTPAALDAAFGPAKVVINTESALGPVKKTPVAMVFSILKIMRNVLGARFSGRYRDNPFFQAGSRIPVVDPRNLLPAERDALRSQGR
jgi:hypothetical protein